jgi:Glyoxalase-like domain
MPTSLIWTDSQVPAEGQVFVDHTAHFVADLERAARTLSKLGFLVSATNLQTNLAPDGTRKPSGTSNRLVRLRRGFLEFLSATHDTPLAHQLQAAFMRYQGLHLIAFSNANLEHQHIRLANAGFELQPLIHMRRQANEPGANGEVAWSVLRTMPGAMAEGRIQYVFPHTPELSWPRGSYDHPNAADSLTGVIVVVADPVETSERFENFTNRPHDRGRIATDRGVIRIVDEAAAPKLIPGFCAPALPYIAAVCIASVDIDKTRQALSRSGIEPLSDADDRLWIGADNALGSYMCFHAKADQPI